MAENNVHPSAVIDAAAVLGTAVTVGPCAVIEAEAHVGSNTIIEAHAYIGHDVIIGEGCCIGVGAVLRDGVVLDNGVRLGAGVVLGTDGFGYVFDGSTHLKIPQVGGVHIGANTIVEADTCIDRATTGTTEVGANSHVGPMVMIGHNCKVGDGCQIGYQVGFAGSSTMGNDCVMAPQSGMAMRAELGDGSRVEFRAAVLRKLPAGSHVAGFPARPVEEARRIEAAIHRLPKVLEALDASASPVEAS
ncbi:UDP-3-O-(3-hydroxymyristoyl)glucosamine N-acyltransferase [bacterium]|nr:UDP-3-O-(3-hydroxymyristoyl)glucosamine N-acyltransferase [bacterium]